MIPSDDRHMSPSNLRQRALSAQSTLDSIKYRNPYVSIFLLDCCHSDYLSESDGRNKGAASKYPSGLAPMYSTRAGSLIGFACQPGMTASDGSGRNGLFTKHILRYICIPWADVQNLLNAVTKGVSTESSGSQVPYQSSNITHQHVCLNWNNAMYPDHQPVGCILS